MRGSNICLSRHDSAVSECVCLAVTVSPHPPYGVTQYDTTRGAAEEKLEEGEEIFQSYILYHEKLPAQWDPGVKHHENTARGTLSASQKLKRKIIFQEQREELSGVT